MRFLVMFVTAVCVLFLIKLRWPKKKNFYKRVELGQKHKFRESRMPFPVRDIRKKSSQHVHACATGDGAICSKNRKIVMGPIPILEIARAYGLRPRLWLLVLQD